jgi:hypothetical protein
LSLLSLIVVSVKAFLFAREESRYLHRKIEELDRVFLGPRLAAEIPPSGLLFGFRKQSRSCNSPANFDADLMR